VTPLGVLTETNGVPATITLPALATGGPVQQPCRRGTGQLVHHFRPRRGDLPAAHGDSSLF
jgi:hypothetical protein